MIYSLPLVPSLFLAWNTDVMFRNAAAVSGPWGRKQRTRNGSHSASAAALRNAFPLDFLTSEKNKPFCKYLNHCCLGFSLIGRHVISIDTNLVQFSYFHEIVKWQKLTSIWLLFTELSWLLGSLHPRPMNQVFDSGTENLYFSRSPEVHNCLCLELSESTRLNLKCRINSV